MTKPSTIPSGPRRRYLIRLATAVLMIFLFGRLTVWLVSLPRYVEAVSTLTVPEERSSAGDITASNAIVQERADTLGVTLRSYAIISILSAVIVIGVNWIVGGLILWRDPNSWFALLTAFVLIMTGSAPMRDHLSIVGRGGLYSVIAGAIWPVFFLWLYLFPNGRPVPRWIRWPIFTITGLEAIVFIIGAFTSATPSASGTAALKSLENIAVIPLLAMVGLTPFSQAYRYLRVSNAIERQQTKWFLFGLFVLILYFAANTIFPNLLITTGALGDLILVIIPITVGFAILRYQLWDIDVIIRRTTSYAIITAMLGLIYFGSIVVLQRLLTPLIGESDVAVVLSTLLIAALFLPIRRRVQDVIDRRFFRRKYDAEKVLAQFAATARDETDLDALTAELLRVIQETMQPASLSIVLFDRSAAERESADARGAERRPN